MHKRHPVLNTGVHVNVLIYIIYLVHVGAPFCVIFLVGPLCMSKWVKKVIRIHHWMSWNKEQAAARGQGDSR